MSPEKSRPEMEPQIQEESEKKRKCLDLYKKALLADDYDTADHLDLSGLEPEELQKTREEVFSQKINAIERVHHAPDVAKMITEFQRKLNINDDVVAEKVRRLSITLLKNPVSVHRGSDGRDYFEHHPGRDKNQIKELSSKFGFKFADSKIREFREDGFVEFIAGYGLNVLKSPEDVASLLKIFKLDESIVNSKKMKEMIARRIMKELSKAVADRPSFQPKPPPWAYSDLGKILSHRNEAYFPSEELRVPETQGKIDDWFSKAIGEVPTKEIKEDDFKYLEKVFQVNSILAVSPERLTAPEVKTALSQYLKQYFDSSPQSLVHRLGIALDQLERVGFSKEELGQMAQSAYLDCLKAKNFTKVDDLQANFIFSEAFLNSTEVVEMKTQTLKTLITEKKFSELNNYLSIVSLPESALQSENITKLKQQLILDALSKYLHKGGIQLFIERLDFSNCPDFFESKELKNQLTVFMQSRLRPFVEIMLGEGFYERARLLDFERQDDHLKAGYGAGRETSTPQLFEATQIAELLRNPSLISTLFLEEYNKVFHKEPEAGKRLVNLQSLNQNTQKLDELFRIDPSVGTQVAFEFLMQNADTVFEYQVPALIGKKLFILTAENIKKYQKEFRLSDDQARQLALKAFDFFAKHGDAPMPPYSNWNINNSEHCADALYKEFNLTPHEAHDGAMALYVFWKNRRQAEFRAIKIKEKYQLDVDASDLEQRMKQNKEEALLAALRGQDIYRLISAMEDYKVSREFAQRADVRELAMALLRKALSDPYQTSAARTLAAGLLPDVNGETIFAMSPVVAAQFKILREKFPTLASRCTRSADAAISIFASLEDENLVGILEKHPVLEQAVIGNEQYGLKLLFKFDSLDKLSRGNIEALYRFKGEVLAENPEIEVDSPEFRIAMQEKLKDYRRNSEILRSMEKAGIDTEVWLSYTEEQSFGLGQEASVPFSEMIITPIKRIEATLDHYKATVMSVLNEYKKELSEARVPSKDIEELKRKLEESIAQKTEAERKPGTRNGLRESVSALKIWKDKSPKAKLYRYGIKSPEPCFRSTRPRMPYSKHMTRSPSLKLN